ncbi:MAG: hypothetical protein FJ284_14125 [Planctomycetes bacterium]|nr:hypothetical protein [Planctomycetota bacterium]
MGVDVECEMLVGELRDDAEFIAMASRLHEAAGELLAGEPQSVAEFAASLVAVWDRLERQR